MKALALAALLLLAGCGVNNGVTRATFGPCPGGDPELYCGTIVDGKERPGGVDLEINFKTGVARYRSAGSMAFEGQAIAAETAAKIVPGIVKGAVKALAP